MLLRVAIGLVSVPLYTKMLGMSQWGLLALFQAATSPLALLDLGLGAATVKYVAEFIGRGDRPSALKVFHTTLLFNLAMGAVGSIGLLLSAHWLATSLFAIPPSEVARAIVGFRVMAVSWLVGVLTATGASVLNAHQRYDASSRMATLAVLLTVGAGITTAALGGDIVAVLGAQTAASAILAVAYFRIANRLLPGVVAVPRWNGDAFRRSFGFGIWQAVAMGGGFLSGWGDRYILGAFFAPAVVGFYSIINILYTQLYVMFLEMGEVLFPAVSHLEGRQDLAGARRLTLLVGWTLTTGFGIGASVLATIGGDFLQLWISPEAAHVATATLRLLCIGGIIGMPAIAIFYFLLGLGKTRWDAASAMTVGATVVGVDLVLVPRIGMVGLGYGLIAGVVVRWCFLVLIWRAHFSREVRFGQFAVQVFAPALVSVAILLAMTGLHDHVGRAPSWPWLLMEGGISLMVATGLQLGAGQLLPGGRQRLREVVSSFRPLLANILGAFHGERA
jgi:O-antigen/teichoic acid export membrane protein